LDEDLSKDSRCGLYIYKIINQRNEINNAFLSELKKAGKQQATERREEASYIPAPQKFGITGG
jgi:hypothetical protein